MSTAVTAADGEKYTASAEEALEAVKQYQQGPKNIPNTETQKPTVSDAKEEYSDEKERRLAEFVVQIEKERADKNGAAARQVQETMINNLINESERVSYETICSFHIG